MQNDSEELEFIDHLTRSRRYGVILTGIIGLLIFDLYAIVDYLVYPKAYQEIWLIRLGVSGFIIMSLGTLATPFGGRHLRSLTLGIAIAVSLSVIWIWNIANAGALPDDIAGITLIALFSMNALRLLLREALIYAVIIAAAFFITVHARGVATPLLTYYYVNLPPVLCIGIAVAYLTEMYARKSFADEKTIQIERARSDELLLKTFPSEIAAMLKSKPDIIAKREDNATVMFCDIAGFTSASAKMEPEELVRTLNKLFSALDRLTAQHGCEKIKTIGDAYMAVCGVPNPAPDHAERIVSLAIELNALLNSFTLNDEPVRGRIGINSGPVVAGVIGESRFAYDLWGDTVNTASRMESTAPHGGIQISEATKLALGDKFDLQELPPINVKGKGMMNTWLVLGRKELGEPQRNEPQKAA